MIIHFKDDFQLLEFIFQKPLKYSDSYTFIPIQIKDKYAFQTPTLYAPYGIQQFNDKKIIDLSFYNQENDENITQFNQHLKQIEGLIKKKYQSKYQVRSFLKTTQFGECIRFKIDHNLLIFDTMKHHLSTIDPYSYGSYLIRLHGLWIFEDQLWVQWYLLQAKIMKPIYFDRYLFIDNEPKKILPIPPPPPLPTFKKSKQMKVSKINALDLQQVVLKPGKLIPPKKNKFAPPSLKELQITLSKLKSIQ